MLGSAQFEQKPRKRWSVPAEVERVHTDRFHPVSTLRYGQVEPLAVAANGEIANMQNGVAGRLVLGEADRDRLDGYRAGNMGIAGPQRWEGNLRDDCVGVGCRDAAELGC